MSRVTCHVSHVMCHVSHVTCHVSRVTCHVSHVIYLFIFYLFFGQSGEAYRWRVCYQRGLPRLVFTHTAYYNYLVLQTLTEYIIQAFNNHFSISCNVKRLWKKEEENTGVEDKNGKFQNTFPVIGTGTENPKSFTTVWEWSGNCDRQGEGHC